MNGSVCCWAPVPESNRLDLAELQDRIHALTGDVPLLEGRKESEGSKKEKSYFFQGSSFFAALRCLRTYRSQGRR